LASVLQKLQIVEEVVNGATFRQVGKMIGLSGARTAQNFYSACEYLNISKKVDELRRDPEAVLDAVRRKRQVPVVTLPEQIVRKLLVPSGYRHSDLTPKKIAAKSGSDMLHKFGPQVVLEVQKWLAMHGLALQVSEAAKPHDLAAIDEAVVVLKVYGISVDVTWSSMSLWRDVEWKEQEEATAACQETESEAHEAGAHSQGLRQDSAISRH
jgi:hypothetical protein